MRLARQSTKYTRLLSNTVLFGISTFSSKVLSFVLMRLYTSVLTEASFGLADLITAAANLLIPLVSLGISNAVIRFGLEKGVSKEGVFTGGLVAIGGGFAVLVCFFPLISQIPQVQQYVLLLYLYVLVSCLRTLCCQFVRARMLTKLYALDGILSTVYTVGLSVLFLVVFKLGATGYLLSIIVADALSTVGLILVAGLWRYIKPRQFDGRLFKSMLRYSLPLVPALMFWWITNMSDRFFISFMCGTAENGLYAAAYKVPSIVAILSTIFTEAWQLSAVADGQDAQRNRFFTNIFNTLSGVVFVVGGVLIYACRLIMRVLVSPEFFPAWEYIPFLVCSTVFSCLVAFLNSVYMVEKRSGRALVTMLVGALANLALNALLIPAMGPNGAALATFISYLAVFIIRAVDTQRFIKIRFEPFKLLANTTLMMAIALVMISEVTLWPLWAGLVLALIVILNGKMLYQGLVQLLKQRKKKAETA